MEIQWSLVSFTALAGAGAWLFFCVGVDAFVQRTNKAAFPASLLAVVLLALGGLCSVTHLSHPDRMLGALAHPAPGIFLEALLLGLLAVVAIVFAVLVKRQAGAGVRKALALVGMVLALAFTFSCGSSYLMASQAAWNTPTLPLAYLGTAAASGTAVWAVLTAVLKEDVAAVRLSGWEVLVGGAAALVLSAAYGFVSGMAVGEQALLFWAAVAVCGGALPMVCGWVMAKHPDKGLAYAVVALVGALVGSVALRALMWLAGSALMSLFGVSI